MLGGCYPGLRLLETLRPQQWVQGLRSGVALLSSPAGCLPGLQTAAAHTPVLVGLGKCIGVTATTGDPNSGGGNGDGGNSAGGDRSMIDVLCAQRDRLRDRAARLEEGDHLLYRWDTYRIESGL